MTLSYGQSELIKAMKGAGIALTRENYISLNFGSSPPDPWTFEDECDLPEQFQDAARLFKYDRDNDEMIYVGDKYADAGEGNPYHRGGGREGGQFTSQGQAGMAGERGGAAGKRGAALRGAVEGGAARYSKVVTHSKRLGKAELRAARYEQLKRQGAAHPGKGYSKGALVDEHGIIHTDDVRDVARALYEAKHVNLIAPEKVSVAIEHLGQVASRMARMSPDSPKTFDLCNVTVENSSLFCIESKGIPRIKMPQLKGKPDAGSPASKMEASAKGEVDLMPAFREHLTRIGYTIEDTEERADHLKATQNELNGEKIAGMAKAMRAGKIPDEQLLVSHDNYIVDGHHRWASKVAIDYDDGRPGDVKQPIARVDAGIIELLALSLKFAKQMGIPQAGVAALLKHPLIKDALEDIGYFEDLNPDPLWTKGEKGLFTGSEAGPEHEGLRENVVSVGGDAWNRETAIRLEREYQAAKPAVEQTLQRMLAESAAVQRSWEQLTPAQQAEAKVQHRASIFHIKGSEEEHERWAAGSWAKLTPEQRFYYAKVEHPTTVIEEPEHYDPMQEWTKRRGQGAQSSYMRTQVIAQHLFEQRAMELLRESGTVDQSLTPFILKGRVRDADRMLWQEGWVDGGSTSDEGLMLQLAAHDELGSRHRPSVKAEFTEGGMERDLPGFEQLRSRADDKFSSIGGWKGVRKLTRAKWETTQYMLDRAGIDDIDLYRGLHMEGMDAAWQDGTLPVEMVDMPSPSGALIKSQAIRLADWHMDRNGMQSTSLTDTVANGWDGSKDRVVIRVRAPRTAIISVPAHGENEYEEREVVLLGTAWKAWDAFLIGAPSAGLAPIK